MKFFILILFLLPMTVIAKKKVILIDPGHGGNDPGSLGASDGRVIKEKDLTLKIAKKVKRLLYKNFDIYLSRSRDKYLSLKERAGLAQLVKADLFISIHFNSSKNNNYRGFETYYLDNNENKAVGKLELEQSHGHNHELTQVDKILIDLVIKKTVSYSRKLSYVIHKEISNQLRPLGFRDRGVKADIFYVLALSKTPGVLLEAGFLSNKEEIKKILDESHQQKLAQGIAKGIEQYFSQLK